MIISIKEIPLLAVLGVFLCQVLPSVSIAEDWNVLRSIDVALSQSDQAHEYEENILIGKMNVAAADHHFDTQLVPLTSLGFTQGTGTQQLGLEFRKQIPTGTAVSYGFIGNRLDDNSGYVVANSTSARAYVRVSQGLMRRWGEKYNLTDLNTAELRQKEMEIRTERARQTLILTTVQQYYDLVLARQLQGMSEKALQRSKEHLQSAQSRQAVGLVSKVDVYRAELAVLDAEAVVQSHLRQKQRAEEGFRELLRVADDENIAVPATVDQMSPLIPESWEEELLQTRLDWQAHRIEMQVNGLEVDKALIDMQPDLGLSLTLEQMGEGESAEDAIGLDQTNWSVQLQMLSTLDQFNEENALLRKKIERKRLRRAEQALRRKIMREAREAFQDLLMEDRNHQLNLKRLHQAAMAVDLAKTRYEKGLSNNLDVLDAETVYSDAEIHISRSLSAYNMAAVSLAHKLGILDREWVAISLHGGENDPVAVFPAD